VLALAHGLLRLGIDRGDRVGIWAPNCPEWTLLQYATAGIGAILVPVNPAYRTDELAYVVNQAGIRLLVAVGERSTLEACPNTNVITIPGTSFFLARSPCCSAGCAAG
jgi:acyl-CoA synthetase (AMP-forming)/AMP-acid ligase II